jgi:hypothetical protein
LSFFFVGDSDTGKRSSGTNGTDPSLGERRADARDGDPAAAAAADDDDDEEAAADRDARPLPEPGGERDGGGDGDGDVRSSSRMPIFPGDFTGAGWRRRGSRAQSVRRVTSCMLHLVYW